ncbi:MAG: TatD family hydrolase [Chlorobiaceae bacterium]|nr:TatD family hydrolase [Chlorobiaceae bacterium]
MFADTHCHLSFPEFDGDRAEVIGRLLEEQVSVLIDPGTDVETSRRSIELSRDYDFIFANVGLHPHETNQPVGDAVYGELEQLAREPKVVAIGEIGLDYHYPGSSPHMQQEAFRRMLSIARSLDLPVVIHCRDAWPDMLAILAEQNHSGFRGSMHCFSGGIEEARQCIRLGLKLSIPGTVTYKKSPLPQILKSVSLADLLTETDAPYLAPVPFRGKRNEPAYVRFVTMAVAEALAIPVEKAAEEILRNTVELFRLSGLQAPRPHCPV